MFEGVSEHLGCRDVPKLGRDVEHRFAVAVRQERFGPLVQQ